jgi:hypothetical protein
MEDSIESVSWTLKVFTTALPYGWKLKFE